ncbi:MAG: hypothetical protein IJY38_03125, partial [Clostridia bacterium]|nr:hypothetical protein [Clostridia bacterium]
ENGDMNASFTADTTGKIAVGYYFDEDFTVPVPYSYVPTRDVTFYVNFADYSDVAGTYYLKNAYKPELVQLVLNTDGTFTYTDGNKTSTSTYVYDGESILFNDARFARYACVYENSLDPYVLKNYRAKVNASGELEIYDNSFYTESAPLVATVNSPVVGNYALTQAGVTTIYEFYSDGTLIYYVSGETETKTAYTLSANGEIKVNGQTIALVNGDQIVSSESDTPFIPFDAFHGEWTFSSLTEEKITFNSVDKTWTWNSAMNAEKLSGTYEIVDGKAVLYKESTQLLTLTIEDGFIEYLGVAYYQNGLAGTWQDYYYGVTLTLDGVGGGSMIYENALHQISYVQESHRDNFYTVYNEGELFAYLQYNAQGKYLDVVFNILDNTGSAVQGLKMWRYDELNGDWISSTAGFETVSFNGYGAYDTTYTVGEHSTPIKGELTIDGDSVPYTLTGDFTATFTYKSTAYKLTYLLTNNTLKVESNTEMLLLVRQDKMSGVTLFNETTGAELSFNGRSSVNGGVATYKDTNGTVEYTYDFLGEDIRLSNGTTTFYLEENGYYVVKDASMAETGETYSVKTVFTGDWAISNAYALLTIGGETVADDMSSVLLKGTYLGKAVTFKKLSEVKLSFTTETGKTMYVFALEGGDIAISPDPEIYYGTYTFCAKVDEMFGEWKKESGPFVLTLSFDGMNGSNYAYARAVITNRGTSVEYYYMVAENGDIILSSVNPINDVYYNYKVGWCVGEDPLAYSNGEKSFRLVQIDSLYGKTLEFGGVEYTFDGIGTAVTANGSYEYEIVSYSEDGSTVTVLLDGEREITFPVND